ncbi:MAG: hypothetical protein PHP59_06685 [Methanofollis sp.]|uniref:hypothetical protein n=1 Tax=Methanofollis sp. TaxID=2052835 RepID=UPI00260D1C3F|nr:hypothetical protein [Methanofollis sp.]MDD4255048.1 hypothetical protein [Methanofollis sp.]
MRQALRYALIFLVSLALFSAFFILPMVGESSGYLVASPSSPLSESSSVVVHLTEEDFAAHPALHDLVVEGKKVRRPTAFSFLPPPGDDWSAIVLSRDEEQALWWTYMFVQEENDTHVSVFLEYAGTYCRLAPSQG